MPTPRTVSNVTAYNDYVMAMVEADGRPILIEDVEDMPPRGYVAFRSLAHGREVMAFSGWVGYSLALMPLAELTERYPVLIFSPKNDEEVDVICVTADMLASRREGLN